MRVLFVYAFFSIGWMLTGCATKDEIPKGVLTVDKMKPLVLDMMLLADYHKDRAFTDSTFDAGAANRAGFERVLQLHKVSKTTFQTSYAYYQKRPALLKLLTDSLQSASQRLTEEIMATSSDPQNQ